MHLSSSTRRGLPRSRRGRLPRRAKRRDAARGTRVAQRATRSLDCGVCMQRAGVQTVRILPLRPAKRRHSSASASLSCATVDWLQRDVDETRADSRRLARPRLSLVDPHGIPAAFYFRLRTANAPLLLPRTLRSARPPTLTRLPPRNPCRVLLSIAHRGHATATRPAPLHSARPPTLTRLPPRNPCRVLLPITHRGHAIERPPRAPVLLTLCALGGRQRAARESEHRFATFFGGARGQRLQDRTD